MPAASPTPQDYRQLAGVLGLPSRSPDYYELLGVRADGCNRLSVDLAAALRSEHLQSLDDPQLAAAIGRVLGEIARAAACLGDAECRRRYDERRAAPALVPLGAEGLILLEDDPLGVGLQQSAKAVPTWNEQAEAAAQQRLILRAAAVAGAVVVLLVFAIIATRLVRSMPATLAQLPAPSAEILPSLAPPNIIPPSFAPPAIAPPEVVPPPVFAPEASSSSEPTEVTAEEEPSPAPVLRLRPSEPKPEPPAGEEPMDEPRPSFVPQVLANEKPPAPLNENATHLPSAVELPAGTNVRQVALLDLAERWIDGFGLALDCGAAEEPLTIQAATHGNDRIWEVSLATPKSVSEPVAEFALDGKQLKFRWTSGGAQRGGEHLRNCTLEISGSKHLHGLALRKAIPLTPLKLAFKERRMRIDIPGETPPDRSALYLEIGACEGFVTSPAVEPTDRRAGISSRGAIKLAGWDRAEIAYSLDESASQRSALFDARMFVNKTETAFTFTEVARLGGTFKASLEHDSELLARLQAKIAACDAEAYALRNNPLANPLTAQAESLIRGQRLKELNNEVQKAVLTIKRLQKEMPRAKAMLDQSQQLATEMETIVKSAKIHYRVVAKGHRHEITLATTQP